MDIYYHVCFNDGKGWHIYASHEFTDMNEAVSVAKDLLKANPRRFVRIYKFIPIQVFDSHVDTLPVAATEGSET